MIYNFIWKIWLRLNLITKEIGGDYIASVFVTGKKALRNADIARMIKDAGSAWDSEQEKWWFSIVDVVEVLTESVDSAAYWRKLKQRLKDEGNETVTNCNGLKMLAPDGKIRLTDVADIEQLLRRIVYETNNR